MQNNETVVIVGGGIVGLSCAYFVRMAGLRVIVLDPQQPRGQASFGNAGVLAVCDALPLATPGTLKHLPAMLLSPSSPLKIRLSYLPTLAPWLFRFIRAGTKVKSHAASIALYALLSRAAAAHEKIATAAGARDLIGQTGWLKAFQTTRSHEHAATERQALARLGVPMRDLREDELAHLLPGAPGLFRRGTLYPSCEQIRNPGRYVEQIVRANRAIGVEFVAGKAEGFLFEQGVPCAVRTGDAPLRGDYFVLAAGAWSKRLAAQLGNIVPLDTERGYHAMLEPSGPPPFSLPVLWSEKSIVLSPLDSGLRITSSVEFAGLHAPPCYTNINKRVAEVRNAIPALKGAVSSRWLGFRPSMPDSLPVIGAASRHRNCFMAFGHGHLGLTLGPITGQLIAQLIQGIRPNMDIKAFSPSRF